MYIKNIGELIKDQLPLKLRFFEGNSIHGKLISLEDGKGAIKLYDGTIIPAIFINENNLEKNKFTKFVIQGIDEDNLILKAVQLQDDISDEKSIEWILKDLNIPLDKGKDIISSLLKFNIPASDSNIISIYKNVKFLDNLKNMSDADVLTFLQNNIDSSINQNSNEFLACKQIISILKNVNCDFITFLIQNDIPLNIENILKAKDFVDNKFFINSLIDNLKQNIIKTKSEIPMGDSPNLNTLIKNGENAYEHTSMGNMAFNNDSNTSIEVIINNIDTIKTLYDEYGMDKLKNITPDELKNILAKDKNITLKDDAIKTIRSFLINLSENQTNIVHSILRSNKLSSNQEITIDDFLNIIKKNSLLNTTELNELLDKLKNTLETHKFTSNREVKIDNFLNIIKEISFNTDTNKKQVLLNNIKDSLQFDNDDQLFNFIKTNIDKNIIKGSDSFNNIKQLLGALKNSNTLESLPSMDILNNKNEYINNVNINKSMILEILGKLGKSINIKQENINIVSLNDMIKTIQHNPETLKDLNNETLKNFINNIDIFKNIDKNYNFYHFNLYNNQDILKNTIIIKNKYKSSKYIDVNDVKVFISVDTSRLGTIEGYLYKKYNDLFISLNVHEDNINFVKDNLSFLKSRLLNNGYNVIDISVDKVISEFDIVNLSTFFNDAIFNELDVKV